MLVSVNLSDQTQEFVYDDFRRETPNLMDKSQSLQRKNALKPFQVSVWKISNL